LHFSFDLQLRESRRWWSDQTSLRKAGGHEPASAGRGVPCPTRLCIPGHPWSPRPLPDARAACRRLRTLLV